MTQVLPPHVIADLILGYSWYKSRVIGECRIKIRTKLPLIRGTVSTHDSTDLMSRDTVTYSVLGCSFKYEDRRRIFRLG